MSRFAAKSPATAVVWLGGTAPLALEPAAGRPIAGWVLELARELGCARLASFAPGALSARVDEAGLEGERLDRQAMLTLLESGEDVLLLRGDAPLLTAEVLAPLLSAARPARLYQPGGLVIAARVAGAELGRPDESDAPLEAVSLGGESFYVPGEQAEDTLMVRHRRDHALAQRRLWRRLAEGWLDRDVAIADPHRITIDASVQLAPGAVVHPDVSLLGETSVGPGCELHSGSWLRDARLGSDVEVLPYSVLDGASLADGCRVGPFARLRPGTALGEGARVGNFVEVKNATLGPGAKANHLAYVGDAEVGDGTNIGAGVVTCNYDGVRKHRTTIGKDAFVGTDTILVAPVEVGDGAFIAAGSVIVRDVPGDALGIARSRQRNISGWASSRGPRARRDDESS